MWEFFVESGHVYCGCGLLMGGQFGLNYAYWSGPGITLRVYAPSTYVVKRSFVPKKTSIVQQQAKRFVTRMLDGGRTQSLIVTHSLVTCMQNCRACIRNCYSAECRFWNARCYVLILFPWEMVRSVVNRLSWVKYLWGAFSMYLWEITHIVTQVFVLSRILCEFSR